MTVTAKEKWRRQQAERRSTHPPMPGTPVVLRAEPGSSPTIPTVSMTAATAKELQRVAKKLGQDMTERQRLIIKARLEGATFRDIGDKLGVSHVTVMNILEKAGDENLHLMTAEENRRGRRDPGA